MINFQCIKWCWLLTGALAHHGFPEIKKKLIYGIHWSLHNTTKSRPKYLWWAAWWPTSILLFYSTWVWVFQPFHNNQTKLEVELWNLLDSKFDVHQSGTGQGQRALGGDFGCCQNAQSDQPVWNTGTLYCYVQPSASVQFKRRHTHIIVRVCIDIMMYTKNV
jgi:hypothetical protein